MSKDMMKIELKRYFATMFKLSCYENKILEYENEHSELRSINIENSMSKTLNISRPIEDYLIKKETDIVDLKVKIDTIKNNEIFLNIKYLLDNLDKSDYDLIKFRLGENWSYKKFDNPDNAKNRISRLIDRLTKNYNECFS